MNTTVKLNLERGSARITTPLYLGAETTVVFDVEGDYNLIFTAPCADIPAKGVAVWAQSENGSLKLDRQALLDAFIKADARQPNMTVMAKLFVTDSSGNVVADGETAIEYSPEYVIDPAEYPSAREVLGKAETAKTAAENAANSAEKAKSAAETAKTGAESAKGYAQSAADRAANSAATAASKVGAASDAASSAESAAALAGSKAGEAAASASSAVEAQNAAEKARDEAKASIKDFSAELDKKVPIGDDGKIPSQYLPSYVDDVIEAASFGGLPASGESGKIYVARDIGKTYRWSGSIYVEISKPVEFGETAGTAFEGNKGKALEATVDQLSHDISSESARAKKAEAANAAEIAKKANSADVLHVKARQELTDEEKEIASVNGGYRYLLHAPTPSSENVDGTEYLKYELKDYAINVVTLDTSATVRFHMPAPIDSSRRCRDFILKLKVTADPIPEIVFVKSDADASIGFESSNDDWAIVEAGINYFTFTETERDA